MGYVNLPPSLQATFQTVDDRITKVENSTRFTMPAVATDPVYTRNGDLWINTTGNDVKYVDANGATQVISPASASGSVSGNVLINGGFDVWQRGTSGTQTSPGYLADRWYTAYNILDTGTATVDRYLGNAGPGSQYSVRIGASTGALSGGVTTSLSQVIETANTIPLVGRTVTLSAYMMTSDALASTTGTMYLSYSTTVDASVTSGFTVIGSIDFVGTSASPTRTTLTVTVPSNAQTLLVTVSPTNFLYQKLNYAYISGVQLEAGEVATPFTRAGLSIGGELSLCQRYFYIVPAGSYGVSNPYYGVALTSGLQVGLQSFPLTMRTSSYTVQTSAGAVQIPFTYVSNTAGATISRNIVANAIYPSAVNWNYSTTYNASATLTAGYAVATNTNDIWLNAEL
jgi:hypothetical protein